jgi:D-lyxose ketol-isomerase
MISKTQWEEARQHTEQVLRENGLVLTPKETSGIEVADFGLSDLDAIGLQLVTYINTSRVCSKELVLKPWQTCPEHRHPTVNGLPGKEETFRCRAGLVYLYVSGESNCKPQMHGLDKYAQYLNVAHQIVLHPGEQYTLAPDTLHWFRAGSEGAIVSEFSSPSTDENDIFTDPRIQRIPKIDQNG